MKKRIHFFFQQVRGREGEYEQVSLRVVYSLAIFLYMSIENLFNQTHVIPSNVYVFSIIYLIISVGLFFLLLFKQAGSRKRQWVSMIADIGAITYALLYLQEMGFLLFGIYLWVIVGNGIRYGIPSLIVSYLLSLVGFAMVVTLNPFWNSQPFLAVGLMLTLILIPLYLLKLLKQLNNAIKAAREANMAKSRFLAHMSHEMRTPLNGVIGTSDLLTTTPLNGEQFDLVNTLKISAQTLLQLIENVLDFSKIESGKLVSEKIDFDLHQLVRGTLEMFKSQAKLQGLRLEVRFSSDTCFLLKGDTLHLRQIIINLVGNAIKFTDRGSVELRVSTLRQDEQMTRIRFEVIDTGIGIAADAQKNIFESFTQASADISRQYGGSGLGTTISRQLATLMGGDLGLQSEPGVGSVFWFELPFEKQTTAKVNLAPRGLGQLRVITLGMKSNERESLGRFLDGWAIHFHHEISIPNFFDRLKQIPSELQKHTIVLCSPQNLGMDVVEFANRVHTIIPSRDVALILVASDLQNMGEKSLLEAGYSCLLRAPVDKTLLFNALHGIMTPQPHQGVISFREHYQRNALEKTGISILLAEDNGTSRKIISKILEYGGHRVDLAENGEEALDKLENKNYGLIILDMNMPLMGGIDVLKIHRAMSRQKPPTPVIVLTANATTEAMRECEEAGADSYMSKPVDAVTLLDAINRLTAVDSGTDKAEFKDQLQDNAASTAVILVKESTLRHLELLGEGQEDFMPIVIRGFISETEKLLEAMHFAISRKDYQALRELAHTIKGSAGNIGAESLHLVCRDLMQLDLNELSEQAEPLLALAQQRFKATQATLIAYLSKSDRVSLVPSSTQ
jgi:two-component system sensor histidine kinase RpfC